jgi:hypothetical protein
VKATSAILPTGIPWADSSRICARGQLTTDPLSRRAICTSHMPSLSVIGRIPTRAAMLPLKDANHDTLGISGWSRERGDRCRTSISMT